MFPKSFPGGPLDERRLIYEALAEEAGDEHPATDPDGPASVDREPSPDAGEDPDPDAEEDLGDDAPATFACLGCGTVTTAPEPPENCPSCHRTPGDRRDGALFQRLD